MGKILIIILLSFNLLKKLKKISTIKAYLKKRSNILIKFSKARKFMKFYCNYTKQWNFFNITVIWKNVVRYTKHEILFIKVAEPNQGLEI